MLHNIFKRDPEVAARRARARERNDLTNEMRSLIAARVSGYARESRIVARLAELDRLDLEAVTITAVPTHPDWCTSLDTPRELAPVSMIERNTNAMERVRAWVHS